MPTCSRPAWPTRAFDVELRGPGFGPYGGGLTFGDMARVDVYVPDDQIDEASYVLLVTEVDNLLDDDPRPRHSPTLRAGCVDAVLLLVIMRAVSS